MKISRKQLRRLIRESFHGRYRSEERARDARAGGYDPDSPIPEKYWNDGNDRVSQAQIQKTHEPTSVADYDPLKSKVDMLRKRYASNPEAMQYLELGFEMIKNVAPGLDASDNDSIHILAQQVAMTTGFSKMMFLPIIRLATQQ